jgi:hypothetical protein
LEQSTSRACWKCHRLLLTDKQQGLASKMYAETQKFGRDADRDEVDGVDCKYSIRDFKGI